MAGAVKSSRLTVRAQAGRAATPARRPSPPGDEAAPPWTRDVPPRVPRLGADSLADVAFSAHSRQPSGYPPIQYRSDAPNHFDDRFAVRELVLNHNPCKYLCRGDHSVVRSPPTVQAGLSTEYTPIPRIRTIAILNLIESRTGFDPKNTFVHCIIAPVRNATQVTAIDCARANPSSPQSVPGYIPGHGHEAQM